MTVKQAKCAEGTAIFETTGNDRSPWTGAVINADGYISHFVETNLSPEEIAKKPPAGIRNLDGVEVYLEPIGHFSYDLKNNPLSLHSFLEALLQYKPENSSRPLRKFPAFSSRSELRAAWQDRIIDKAVDRVMESEWPAIASGETHEKSSVQQTIDRMKKRVLNEADTEETNQIRDRFKRLEQELYDGILESLSSDAVSALIAYTKEIPPPLPPKSKPIGGIL